MLTHERFACPYEFDLALLDPVFYMMRTGIRIDEEKRREFSGQYKNQWVELQIKLNGVVGHELNVNSWKQVGKWLYVELGLPPRKKKGRYKTDEDTLRGLLAICDEKMATLKTEGAKMRWMRGYLGIWHILKIRALRKRISSYIDIEIDDDGRMRCTITVGGTEIGRFTSSKTAWGTGCNMQTIPRELRGMFIADDGYEMCEFDLNRGESWVYAHLSNDPLMLDIHNNGWDFHVITACAIAGAFGEKISKQIRTTEEWNEYWGDDVQKAYKLRYLGKKANHAFSYRMGAFRAAETVNKEADDTGITVTVGQAKKMRQLWLSQYIGIPAWWASIENELREARTLTTPYGRKRTFFARWGDELFKEATASVPEYTSVDYLNLGMLDVFNKLVVPKKYGLQLLHQNHDSILVQYREGERNRVIPDVIELMTRSVKINGHDVTIPIEAEYGRSWGELTTWREAA